MSRRLVDDDKLFTMLIQARRIGAVEPGEYLQKAITKELERRKSPYGRAWL